MMKYMLILMTLLLTSCLPDERKCDRREEMRTGMKVVFKPTGEQVRITGAWHSLTLNCTSSYKVTFKDKAEVEDVSREDLEVIKN